MRSAPFSLWIVGIVAIFPIFGLVMIAIGFRSGLNTIRWMEKGKPSPYKAKNSRNLVPSPMTKSADFQNPSENMEWTPSEKLEFEEMERELDALEEAEEGSTGHQFDSKFPGALDPFPMKSQMDRHQKFKEPSVFAVLKCLALPTIALITNFLGYSYYFLI